MYSVSYFQEEIYTVCNTGNREMHQEAHDCCGYPLGHWVAPLLHSTLSPMEVSRNRGREALFTECLTGNWCSTYILDILFRSSFAHVCSIFLSSLITGRVICQEEGETSICPLISHNFLFQCPHHNQNFFLCDILASFRAVISRVLK